MPGSDSLYSQHKEKNLTGKDAAQASSLWSEYIHNSGKVLIADNDPDAALSTKHHLNALDNLLNASDKPSIFLQGNVEKVQRRQSSKASGQTEAEKTNDDNLTLQKSAKTTDIDPDAGDRALSIVWDAWRNAVVKKAMNNVRKHMNGCEGMVYNRGYNWWEPRFSPGLSIDTTFTVDANKHITNITVLKTSGQPDLDKIILKSITQLDGKKILAFPIASRRTEVRQPFTVLNGPSVPFGTPIVKDPTFIYNDIERINYKDTN